MFWVVLLIIGLFAAGLAFAIDGALKERRRHWSRMQRVFAAAAPTPAVILLLVLAAVAWYQATGPRHGESNRDLLSFLVVVFGTIVGAAAVVGGVVGALLREDRADR